MAEKPFIVKHLFFCYPSCLKQQYSFTIMRKRTEPSFTHFACLPLSQQPNRLRLIHLQQSVSQALHSVGLAESLTPNNQNLFHLTLCMLTLPHSSHRQQLCHILDQAKEELAKLSRDVTLTAERLKYFTRRQASKGGSGKGMIWVSVIYLELREDEQMEKVRRVTDKMVRAMVSQELVAPSELRAMKIQFDHNSNMFKIQHPHITLFRCHGLTESPEFLKKFDEIASLLQGQKFPCPTLDIATRFSYDTDGFYQPLWQLGLHAPEP